MGKRVNHIRLSKREDYVDLLINDQRKKEAKKFKKKQNPRGQTIGDIMKKSGKADKIQRAITKESKKINDITIQPLEIGNIEMPKSTTPVESNDTDDNEEDFSED